ncbi:MAG: NUDIX domain-containing protein [Candidatus Thiodiazotropha sp.]|jgi:NAD+ diphosphatase
MSDMRFCTKCGSDLLVKTIDGASRLVCTNADCDYTVWNNPVPVVAALVKLNDNYILARNTQWPHGVYSLITGYLESNENVEDAVLREVEEELGLKGRVEKFLGHYTFQKKNQLIIAFEIHATGIVCTNDEIAETIQLSAEELTSYDFRKLKITEQVIKSWAAE